MSANFILFTGNANPAIARELGVGLGKREVERFPDGEVSVRLLETVRRKEVFLIQPTSPPVNDHLLELLALADACRRSAAARITAVVPYYGYSRSDKRHGRREPIMGRVVADLMRSVGVAHVVTVDLHTAQIEGFFKEPVDSLTAVPTLCRALSEHLPSDAVVVAPDSGRVVLATQYAQCLGRSLVVLHKRRDGSEVEVTRVVGDVSGRACLLIDDMISTGGTLAKAIQALLAKGARPAIMIAATHGLLLPGARAKLDSDALHSIYVTDTVKVPSEDWAKLRVVSVAPSIARALQHFMADGSISGPNDWRAPAEDRQGVDQT